MSRAPAFARPQIESPRPGAANPSPDSAPRYIEDGPSGRHVAVLRRHLLCFLCGSSVGYLDALAQAPHIRRLRRTDGRSVPLPVQGGLPRCSFCGGSLYLDEAETITYWPRVPIGHEKPGRKPRALRGHAECDAEMETAG
jgi:hypothetical protein